MTSGERNLEKMFAQADEADLAEGQLAYLRYHQLMKALAEKYNTPLDRAVAVFCALSPNNDYYGNLRSLVSVLEGFNKGIEPSRIVISTYNHCKMRALDYLAGKANFVNKSRGLKILNFYHNVLYPESNHHVTIDGHMVAAWRGKNLTMKQALVKGAKEYYEIAAAVKQLAFHRFLIPNQYQAIVWFARKRTLNIKYDPQHDLFYAKDDFWKTSRSIHDLKPYEART